MPKITLKSTSDQPIEIWVTCSSSAKRCWCNQNEYNWNLWKKFIL